MQRDIKKNEFVYLLLKVYLLLTYIVIVLVSCNMFICQNIQKHNMVLLKLNQTFVEALSHLYPLNKDGLTVAEIMDFMFSIAENCDIELYNKDVNTSLLDNYGETLSSVLVIGS